MEKYFTLLINNKIRDAMLNIYFNQNHFTLI